MQCSASKTKLDEARSKFEFDKSNPQFKAAYIRAIKDYLDNAVTQIALIGSDTMEILKPPKAQNLKLQS